MNEKELQIQLERIISERDVNELYSTIQEIVLYKQNLFNKQNPENPAVRMLGEESIEKFLKAKIKKDKDYFTKVVSLDPLVDSAWSDFAWAVVKEYLN